MKPIQEVLAANGFDVDAHSVRNGVSFDGEESRTIQSQEEDANINTLVRRFGLTGRMPVLDKLPSYLDYEDIFDFQSAQNALIEASHAFMSLPAEVRSRFDNEPQRFLEFCAAEENLPEMEKMGLLSEAAVVARKAKLEEKEKAG